MRLADKKAYERYKAKIELVRSSGAAPTFETDAEAKEIIERCKKDIRFCVEYFFPHYATSASAAFHVEWAEMVKRNPTFKGFAQWGRALAKSVWNNVIIPFWLWLNEGEKYFVVIGNSESRAEQLLEDIRAEFEANPRIIAHFGEQQTMGSWTEGFFVTKSGFIGQALGMGQTVRGLRVKNKRPDHINADDIETKDLTKNPKRQNEIANWIEKDLIPTMDGKIRRFIQSNNRFAPRMVQTILQKKHPKWKVHEVNAYDPVTYEPSWPEKYDAEYFKEIESGDEGIGVIAAHAEYNNKPHVEGEIFKDEQIQWGKMPALNHFKVIVGHWDVAYAGTSTSDYNAVRVWGLHERNFWYITSFVKQSKMRDAVAWICEYQMQLPKTVIVIWQYEAQFWNDELENTIRTVSKEYGITLNMVKKPTRGNKYVRILAGLQPRYQNGRIYYNEKMVAHADTQVGLAQLKGIEPGYKTHDDAPDADENAINELEKYINYANTDSNAANWQSGRMNHNNERI